MRQVYTVIQRGRELGGLEHREGGTIPFRTKFQKKKKSSNCQNNANEKFQFKLSKNEPS